MTPPAGGSKVLAPRSFFFCGGSKVSASPRIRLFKSTREFALVSHHWRGDRQLRLLRASGPWVCFVRLHLASVSLLPPAIAGRPPPVRPLVARAPTPELLRPPLSICSPSLSFIYFYSYSSRLGFLGGDPKVCTEDDKEEARIWPWEGTEKRCSRGQAVEDRGDRPGSLWCRNLQAPPRRWWVVRIARARPLRHAHNGMPAIAAPLTRPHPDPLL